MTLKAETFSDLVLFDAATLATTEILDHVASSLPNEAVGLLWSDSTITPLVNQARSPTRFVVSPTLLAEALSTVDPYDKYLVAIYHSHPSGHLAISTDDFGTLQTQLDNNVLLPWIIVTPDGRMAAWGWNSDLCLQKLWST